MKGIIKNILDVITNSSSEVFVMERPDAAEVALYAKENNTYGCISIKKIDEEWLQTEGGMEFQAICDCLGVENELEDSWYCPTKEEWAGFYEEHKNEIKQKLIGKYFIEIEDHFQNPEEILRFARHNCEYYESRH